MRACVVIPFYDHGSTIATVLAGVERLGLRCFVVDDGSAPAERALLDAAVASKGWITVTHHEQNRGKGAALKTGFGLARRAGFTHALQVDADGQHDSDDFATFLRVAEDCPDAVVLGLPILENAPASRRYGRLITRVWAWIETASREIGDPLCGLRCMPLEPTCRLIEGCRLGDRMDFDPEIAVRLVWEGAPVRNVPSRVRYSPGDVSHFRLWRDNVLISWMHTRLFFGMLWRVKRLLRRRRRVAPS